MQTLKFEQPHCLPKLERELIKALHPVAPASVTVTGDGVNMTIIASDEFDPAAIAELVARHSTKSLPPPAQFQALAHKLAATPTLTADDVDSALRLLLAKNF